MEYDIFKALSDPNRRKLLDLLYQADGRTLNELCEHLDMTRFGVMKHLNILEQAGLITTTKVGREKFHYLNAVPIREIYERWVSKYTEPWISGLTSLKQSLEGESAMSSKPKHIHRIVIKATPEQVWQALTDPSLTTKFWYNGSIHAEWEAGKPYEIHDTKGEIQALGELLCVEPPNKLVMTWKLVSMRETAGEKPSRLTWEIVPHDEFADVTLVTLTHDEFDLSPNTAQVLEQGLPIVLSGLKTVLETGESLTSF